ncbi:hypothetical protein BC827DRAFT_1180973 [Russula dissimulans]|nr:hypothetical protein BC827DRAFT_1180973 [Russula dissimulans]
MDVTCIFLHGTDTVVANTSCHTLPLTSHSPSRFSLLHIGSHTSDLYFEIEVPEPASILGICAMDVKARSKAMREILTRLVDGARGTVEVKVFGDKVILDEDAKGVRDFARRLEAGKEGGDRVSKRGQTRTQR